MKERVYELIGFVYLIGLLILVLVLLLGGSIVGNVISSNVDVEFVVNDTDNLSAGMGNDSLENSSSLINDSLSDNVINDSPNVVADSNVPDDSGTDEDKEAFELPWMWILIGLGVVVFVLIVVIVIVLIFQHRKKKTKMKSVGGVSKLPNITKVTPSNPSVASAHPPIASSVPIAFAHPPIASSIPVASVVSSPASSPSPTVASSSLNESAESLKYLKYYSQNVSHDPKVRIRYLIDSGKKFVDASDFVTAKEIYGLIVEDYKNLDSHDEGLYSEIVNFKSSIK